MASLKPYLSVAALLISSACPLYGVGAAGIFREAPIPTASAGARGIVSGSDGALWFTEFSANKIGRFWPPTGEITEYLLPTPNAGPLGIASVYPNLWFTEFNANKIGKITPGGTITEFSIPTPSSGPFGIAEALGSVWFTESSANKIGRLTSDGTFSETVLPTPASQPVGISSLGDELLFAEFQGNKIGLLRSGVLTEISVPTPNSGPFSVSADDFGQVWFTERNANKIGIVIQGAVTEFPVPTANSGPSGVVADFYGNMVWFLEQSGNQIGSVTKDGRFTEYAVPNPNSEPTGIELISYLGNVFYTEASGNAIGQFHPDAVVFLAARDAGGWTTEFDLTNTESQFVTAFGSLNFSPATICPGFCPREIKLALPAHGSGSGDASQVGLSAPPFGTVLFHSLEDGILPVVKARLVNGASAARSVDVPGIRLSTLAALNPVLVFPSAAKTPGGGHSNLLLAEVGSQAGLALGEDTGLSVSIEAFSSDGQSVGSSIVSVPSSSCRYLVDVLGQLGVGGLTGGQIRVTQIGGGGLMWGYLITASDEGAVGISVGANP